MPRLRPKYFGDGAALIVRTGTTNRSPSTEASRPSPQNCTMGTWDWASEVVRSLLSTAARGATSSTAAYSAATSTSAPCSSNSTLAARASVRDAFSS